jgi:hypothetical protein
LPGNFAKFTSAQPSAEKITVENENLKPEMLLIEAEDSE